MGGRTFIVTGKCFVVARLWICIREDSLCRNQHCLTTTNNSKMDGICVARVTKSCVLLLDSSATILYMPTVMQRRLMACWLERHVMTMPWRSIFACCPPTNYLGGCAYFMLLL